MHRRDMGLTTPPGYISIPVRGMLVPVDIRGGDMPTTPCAVVLRGEAILCCKAILRGEAAYWGTTRSDACARGGPSDVVPTTKTQQNLGKVRCTRRRPLPHSAAQNPGES